MAKGKRSSTKLGGRMTRYSLLKLSTLRLEKRLTAIKEGKISTVSYPRTVEMLPTKTIQDDDGSKLLFALAIGLVPNPSSDKGSGPGPAIPVNRLAPNVIEEARDRTKITIFDICRRSCLRSMKKKTPPSRANPVTPLTSGSNDNIPVIDLVSSDDEDENSSSPMEQPHVPAPKPTVSGRLLRSGIHPTRNSFKKASGEGNASVPTGPLTRSQRPIPSQRWIDRSNRYIQEWMESNKRVMRSTPL